MEWKRKVWFSPKNFLRSIKGSIFLLFVEPYLSRFVQDLICLVFFNRWKKQGPYADQQKMNVIFLKRVQATPLHVHRTNSKPMELLARMQKATASWGDVPPGTSSAPNCLIMVRDSDCGWLVMLIAVISLLLFKIMPCV